MLKVHFEEAASHVALVVKNMPANAGDTGDRTSISGREDPLKEGMATCSSILAWKITWIKEPCTLATSCEELTHWKGL